MVTAEWEQKLAYLGCFFSGGTRLGTDQRGLVGHPQSSRKGLSRLSLPRRPGQDEHGGEGIVVKIHPEEQAPERSVCEHTISVRASPAHDQDSVRWHFGSLARHPRIQKIGQRSEGGDGEEEQSNQTDISQP